MATSRSSCWTATTWPPTVWWLSSTADGSTIRGLVIRDFGGDGIEIQSGSDNNTMAGNFIGRLDTSGADAGAAEANGGSGIQVLGANNTIGGTTLAARNVISGNWAGIYLTGAGASGNVVTRNLFGTDATGTVLIANGSNNVDINLGATNNLIGGVGAGNVIVASANDGVTIWGGATTGNLIQGNFIGHRCHGKPWWGATRTGESCSAAARSAIPWAVRVWEKGT